jgi:Transglycosylase SLT domain
VIQALAFAAALSAERVARPHLRSRLMEAPQIALGAAGQRTPEGAQAVGPAESPVDPEVRRIEMILRKMQQDPALRQQFYDDVDSVVRAVRSRQPIPSNLRVDSGLPAVDHSPTEPHLVATLQPPAVTPLPFPGTPPLAPKPTAPQPRLQPVPARTGKLFSPTGSPLDPDVVKRLIHWAQTNGCPIELALATAWRESQMSLHPARGSSGEIGMMQIMPERARLEGVDPARLEDPETNMWLGTKLLARYYKQEGSVARAAMMYVAGPGVFEKTYGPDLRNYIAHYSASVNNFATYFGTYLNF